MFVLVLMCGVFWGLCSVFWGLCGVFWGLCVCVCVNMSFQWKGLSEEEEGKV